MQRRRDTREHVALYIKALNAWATRKTLTQHRFAARDPVPPSPDSANQACRRAQGVCRRRTYIYGSSVAPSRPSISRRSRC